MTNNAKDFFSNPEVFHGLKAGAAAVLLHTTVDYYKTSDGKEHFHAAFFDKDPTNNNKIVGGMMNFTFAVPISMGVANCAATLKKLAELYPAAENVLAHIADGTLAMPDEEVCKVLADAAAKRFAFNGEGKKNNLDQYISDNFANYISKVSSHYPPEIVNSLKNVATLFEDACNGKKKTITNNQASQMA